MVDKFNRVAIVTGASSGIGEATARAMAARGTAVVITSERGDDLEKVAASINSSGGKAIPITVDFSNPAQTEDLIARAEELAGPLDILVNNAGVGMQAMVGERPLADTKFLFEVNFFALASLCAQALPRMAARKNGRIINVSSAAGQLGCANVSAYSASKGAVHSFTQALRVEARSSGIKVSEIVPISVRTPFFTNVRGKSYKPMGIVLTPEAVANSIVRCAFSSNPRPEVYPFRWIRAAFLLNTIAPGFMATLNYRSFERNRSTVGQ